MGKIVRDLSQPQKGNSYLSLFMKSVSLLMVFVLSVRHHSDAQERKLLHLHYNNIVCFLNIKQCCSLFQSGSRLNI